MTADDTDRHRDTTLAGFARRVVVFVLIVAVALLLWEIVDALLLAFIGILLAVLLRALAGLLSRYTPIPTRWAVPIVLVTVVGLLTLFFWLAGPRIDSQLAQFTEALPTSLDQLREALNRYTWGRYIVRHAEQFEWTGGAGADIVSRVTGAASTVVTVIANILLVLFVAVYFAFNPHVYKRGVLLLVPTNRTARIEQVMDVTGHRLRRWLVGQLISMVSVGVLTAIGLWIAGVPVAFLLGVITGLSEIVPFFGPVVAAIPGILIAVTEGWTTALYAVLVYLAVEQIENHLIVPLVQREAVWLPPALVLLAVVALGLLFGILGVLIATPLTAVLIIWVRMLYVEDALGKSVDSD